MANIKVSITYTDVSCGDRLYKIVVYNELRKEESKIDKRQFLALFGIDLHTHYLWEEMQTIKSIIEDEWYGLIDVTNDDSMDIS